jgi:hypothetical protein
LRKDRELAFCGDVDFIPTDAYSEAQAQRAYDHAAWVLEVARESVSSLSRSRR